MSERTRFSCVCACVHLSAYMHGLDESRYYTYIAALQTHLLAIGLERISSHVVVIVLLILFSYILPSTMI